MKYLFFFLLLFTCNPAYLTLEGSCQSGESRIFEAPNGEYITASVDSVGWLQLTGNLNLVPEPIRLSTELQDTIFEEWEAKPLEHGKGFTYQILLNIEGAKTFEFELLYIDE